MVPFFTASASPIRVVEIRMGHVLALGDAHLTCVQIDADAQTVTMRGVDHTDLVYHPGPDAHHANEVGMFWGDPRNPLG